ncbi:MAG: cyclic nucleotide-binding domain-containing protein [Desulfobacterales bacterium]|jgi:CRP-like cAMP-binding protein|nr:cyclic nucleotide-binding domain-containing protein [Desulfobacterales bacterium]
MDRKEREKLESLVNEYVEQKNSDKACELLLDLIRDYAVEKDFNKAEALLNKIYDVDPMALNEIVRAGEIIEAEKSEGLDREHLEIWPGLYGSLTTSEANALYYSMKPKVFEPGEPVMEQGKYNSRLFFINQGNVKALFKQDDKVFLIVKLGPGDIIGQTPFFTATVCTVSLVAMTRIKTVYLEIDVLKKWKNDVPALESKLYDYCMKHDPVKQALENKNIERRVDKRIAVSGKVIFQLIDGSGKPMGRGYAGELSDISAGGMSFTIKVTKKESIRMLLGRRVQVGFRLPLKKLNYRNIDQSMTVIAAQPQVFDDYSIHLKYDVKWTQKMIDEIDLTRMPTTDRPDVK